MKTLFLHGAMKEKYGESFDLDVASPAEAVRALCVQVPGFMEDVRKGVWHILRGPLDRQDSDDEDRLLLTLGRETEVHLLPALQGANDGFLTAVLGVVLIAVGVFVPGLGAVGVAMIGAGAGMAVGGIIQMTTKLPSGNPSSQESADSRPSFLFDGPVNTSSQGLAVPRGYGRLKVGSVVVSAGLYAEEFSA